MKSNALQHFRQKRDSKRTLLGLWVTLESATITEIAVALGLDWVVIDAEHGHLDWREIVDHVRASVRSTTVVLVRVAELNAGLIKRALDIGADGIVVPMVESAEQFRQAIQFAKYPPEGIRGVGAERATVWGQAFSEHAGSANDEVLVIPIVETQRGSRNIASILGVEGCEAIFFGPADLSASMGARGEWEGPGVTQVIQSMKQATIHAGKLSGVMATSIGNVRERIEEGFGMVGLGTDAGLLVRVIRDNLKSLQRDCHPTTSLETCAATAVLPLSKPPETFRPDRLESTIKLGEGPRLELATGVQLELQVGKHNQARNLTTGYVRFEPKSELTAHTHPFSESVTVITGKLVVEVEGRRYILSKLDNIVIPRETVHAAYVPFGEACVCHIAVPTDNPTRTLVDRFFSKRTMPDNSSGVAGKEHVTRMATAERKAAGPNTEFVDFFNKDIMPGIEMSGGYGLFYPGGRLPAHIHDFDESIAIVSGRATCIVEGRRYELASGETALEPRGRVHYFVNQSNATMEMIWVYAGPVPERIVVSESCATVEGNPWK